MKIENSILITLADGAFHNWDELVGKTAIEASVLHEKIHFMQKSELFVFNVNSSGVAWINPYPVSGLVSVLKQANIEGLKKAVHVALIDSTNIFLKSLSDSHGYVCFAEAQYRGYGRRQDVWSSVPGPLYFSVAWSWDSVEEHSFDRLSVCIGLLMLKALHALGYAEVQLKWPNDLYLKGKKLGGVLVEMVSKGSQLRVILGVGLNVGWYGEKPGVSQSIISLNEIYPNALRYRDDIAVELVKTCFDNFQTWPLKQNENIPNEHDVLFNKPVRIVDKNTGVETGGVGAGFNDENDYLVHTEQGILNVNSLSMSIKLR